ncbi:MAG: transcriptional repressor [Patescibacteria group bacterium]|nr:transcriptional repressor [Patescibacteria group bacterium]
MNPAYANQHKGDKLLERFSAEEISLGVAINATGKRVTPVRLDVLKALVQAKRLLSIKEIVEKVADGHDLSTIYRTLETLISVGLVTKTEMGKTLYEANIGKPHHHHAICTSCGYTEDVDVCISNLSLKNLGTRRFSAINGHNLEFFGLCKKCAIITA